MSKVHLVIPDPHAHPDFNNDRADWLGQFIKELKPDVVVNLGDAADMASLSTFDKGKASFYGRSYQKDIEAHLDFQERMWAPTFKSKKKLPRRVVLEGNHEHRTKRAIEFSPELQGERHGLSFKDYDFNSYYHDVVEYEGQTPGIIAIDGVHYAHFIVAGVSGRPVGGEHHASSLGKKSLVSCTVGHSHLRDFDMLTGSSGHTVLSLVAGVFQDYRSPWAGVVNNLWWSGVVVKREVENGNYDHEWVSLAQLKKLYS
jgi:3',5'-cyclic AMP phosphodiesterase CpdA